MMSRPERTIVALDRLDAQRFARSLMGPQDRVLFFEEADSWTGLWRLLRDGTGTLIVLGARPPDKLTVHRLGPRAAQVVILQHAINRRRSLSELPAGYFISNFRKLVYWSLFSLLCKLIPRGSDTPVHVYHFTPDYLGEWTATLGEARLSHTPCPPPDPTRFGTVEDMPVCDSPVDFQLIDEPFTQTLGISDQQERALLEMILTHAGDAAIKVKPHPRSQPGKYAFSPRFEVCDTLHSHPSAVIGYRSGLLAYPFATPRQLTIDFDGSAFALIPHPREPHHEQHNTYLDVVQRDLDAKNH